MKNPSRLSKAFTMASLATLLIVAAAVWDKSTRQVAAFNPQPDPPAFGMIAITPEQTARLNVVRAEPLGDPDRPLLIEMTFFDSDGNSLLRSTTTLFSGHSAFLDLNGLTVPRTEPRTEVRAMVHVIQPPTDRNRLNLVANIELFDNETGRTTVLLPAVQ